MADWLAGPAGWVRSAGRRAFRSRVRSSGDSGFVWLAVLFAVVAWDKTWTEADPTPLWFSDVLRLCAQRPLAAAEGQPLRSDAEPSCITAKLDQYAIDRPSADSRGWSRLQDESPGIRSAGPIQPGKPLPGIMQPGAHSSRSLTSLYFSSGRSCSRDGGRTSRQPPKVAVRLFLHAYASSASPLRAKCSHQIFARIQSLPQGVGKARRRHTWTQDVPMHPVLGSFLPGTTGPCSMQGIHNEPLSRYNQLSPYLATTSSRKSTYA
ncbi:hypothetical protein PHYSODRAFT_295466 [Phytophthora sojae]|uniref:Uncharacterized protein n=1 Tax=Phytophthora sojae (strain P6497) TaxID=1094619 RepID=G4YR72_PHYSP|nr:hypothetical protein PHYSODRAFT_295466 [Phytophthora sojae]EGZ22806.1 hypothetical protein PHYSODRAFT_295466 [Phytophthora sojae]|eukprot:XP_009518094.1 hypothetical protein PHYSODRAFT_295466 [Phytophthora sojae]